MEGGVSRRRGYLILTAALLLAVVALLCFPQRHHPSGAKPIALSELDSLPQWEQQAEASQRSFRKDYSWQSHTATFTDRRASASRPAVQAAPSKWVVDINHADSAALTRLYGIGPVLARRIVRFRSALGGFVSANQIKEVYGFDTIYFADLAPHVAVDTAAVQKIDINTATVGQLARHPYLDNYQAKAIVRLRERCGGFGATSALLGVPIIDTQTYNKIVPYLICSLQPSK